MTQAALKDPSRNPPSAPRCPNLIAHVVESASIQGRTSDLSNWRDVGAALPHKDGAGYTIHLRPDVQVSNTVVLRAPKNTFEGDQTAQAPAIFSQQLVAYLVDSYALPGKPGQRTQWTEIGRAFPHKDSSGWNVIIRSGMAISGSIVIRPAQKGADVLNGSKTADKVDLSQLHPSLLQIATKEPGRVITELAANCRDALTFLEGLLGSEAFAHEELDMLRADARIVHMLLLTGIQPTPNGSHE